MNQDELPFGIWPRDDQRGQDLPEKSKMDFTQRLQFGGPPDRGAIAREAAADRMRE
jgi:hypothetical protein